LRAGTRIQAIYGTGEAVERYFCSYEVNPAYRDALEAAGLRLSAFSENDDVRAAELPMHPFFVVTLFQPQLSSSAGSAHPLITAFLRTCRDRAQRTL
jgi:CTP synthase (UTP-ammonia lyase)